jgi:hypothetical protein
MKKRGKSLREQELERRLRGMTNAYCDEHTKRVQLEDQYEDLKDNFHQLALMKVKEITKIMIEIEAKKAPK